MRSTSGAVAGDNGKPTVVPGGTTSGYEKWMRKGIKEGRESGATSGTPAEAKEKGKRCNRFWDPESNKDCYRRIGTTGVCDRAGGAKEGSNDYLSERKGAGDRGGCSGGAMGRGRVGAASPDEGPAQSAAWATQSKCGGVVPTIRNDVTLQARLTQAARTRNQAKASASQEPQRRELEQGKRKEAMEVDDDDNEEEEDERLRKEEDQRAEQWARKKGARGEVEPVVRDGPPKRKKYAVRLEEGFDVEKVIDRLLERHNDLMTLKEILASAPRLRDELKGRLSWRSVPNVHLGTILPKEAEWAESGTKMDWKCVACGTVDLVVKGSKCATMMDTGAEMNIIREANVIRFGLDIDRSDNGILHGASCKAVFCGTTSNVLIEVGKVKVRACFFIMPNVDHGILLGRSDFTKAAMPRGGKGTRPPQRPLGASGGYERHGPRHRESTPVYDDGDIELFLDNFWDHARRTGWTVAQAIERLRGASRFEEPIARIRREATTRQEVETRMEEF
ncbi:hypothetical protein CBR_g34222 [Chara braunii]|uniref:Peptidase A2 domain-containing protein n=1 Tax=Chara braunii TaxID=69332 RepID=A0A388LI91_CHABU|nr:hypothetical protein CBR_g34222 [Chara braunii]|eukprot:GBG82040.1 hypothetical protein CBR_g34222 [Chara braunii]